MIYSLIYISKAVALMSDKELEQILQVSKTFNEQHHITGMLLYVEGYFLTMKEGRFMQVLEGTESDVRYLFEEKICKDPRHQSIIVLQSGTIRERNFNDWTMGFQAMDEEDFKNKPNYFGINDYFVNTKHSNVPLNYLKSFYKMSRPK